MNLLTVAEVPEEPHHTVKNCQPNSSDIQHPRAPEEVARVLHGVLNREHLNRQKLRVKLAVLYHSRVKAGPTTDIGPTCIFLHVSVSSPAVPFKCHCWVCMFFPNVIRCYRFKLTLLNANCI